MSEDAELLRLYAQNESEDAFAELVRRHLGFAYAVALRKLSGDTHLAEDVTQKVFTSLARKARHLVDHPTLTGWLFTSTHFAASQVVRSEQRRRTREQLAQAMSELGSDSDPIAWERLRPLLDELVQELGENERLAVALRFFEGRTLADVGSRLRLTEDGARSRVNRALEKIRQRLVRRGITSTSTALAAALSSQPSIAAPAKLVSAIVGSSMAGGKGIGASTLAFLLMNKSNIAIATALVLAGLGTTLIEARSLQATRADVIGMRAEIARIPQLRSESERLTTELTSSAAGNPAAQELAELRRQAAMLEARPAWVDTVSQHAIADAKNAGWDTADAALETFLWARYSGDRQTLIENFAWVGLAKPQAEAAFAALPQAIRERYGTADRFAGTVLFGNVTAGAAGFRTQPPRPSSPPTAIEVDQPDPSDPITDYWADIDPDAANPRPGIQLKIYLWIRTRKGQEKRIDTNFVYVGDGRWSTGTRVFSDAIWQQLLARINPVTGELLPEKGN